MHDPHRELTPQQEMTTGLNSAARYAAGPSTGRSHGEASAPGVAEALGHQGAPEEEQPDAAAPPRAADAAALHRVARRRKADPNGRRKERVDARYSNEEKAAILAKARSLNISGAHYVSTVILAHVYGDVTLADQRTPLDDLIDELNALRRDVAAVGNNTNQIARKLNSGGTPHPGDRALLAQTERTLTSVASAVDRISAAANQVVAGRAGR
ncbi:plasmid mobilization relaxosome protein MobC [Streptomyces sp. BH-SS-21]|uniref:Plasmid mobilization relaxosome protein MobC n=1 Tax=Streptomyces liliiviolaceus TaxID=2823109 RepID=A0A940XZX6_9ACTN|nr:plasmid mobilization relaxosome protein MobC [Streptomyces liliiviolaceus]MBQ0848139.1 plasmid mobilization relaxosome protein MobC [Streptomyces liliiviolaceus]